nr:hypothetical protein [Bacteroides thetaiotaomicron]
MRCHQPFVLVDRLTGFRDHVIEIFTQLGYVLVISFFIYFILWIPRILIIGLRHLLRKKK